MAPSAPLVSYLLFANDSLLFFIASREGEEEVSHLLDVYCKASSQKINKEKSSVFFSKKCPPIVKEEVKGILNVNNESLSEKYLGMPSDVGRSKTVHLKF